MVPGDKPARQYQHLRRRRPARRDRSVRGMRARRSVPQPVVRLGTGFTMTIVPGSESHSILVASGSSNEQWVLTTSRRGRDWLVAIAGPDGNRREAEGPDLFEALRTLRRALDPRGIRLAVNGARRDAWSSGMQRDMGEGRVVYLPTKGESGRPPQVRTLGPASLLDVGTVREQDEQHRRWLSSRPGAR
jgi:hypothetical protein